MPTTVRASWRRGRRSTTLAAIFLAALALPALAAPEPFVPGIRVVVDGNARVHAAPRTSGSLGVHREGMLGTIMEGPVVAEGSRWWRIDYESDIDGWTQEKGLDMPYFPPAAEDGGWRSLVKLDRTPSTAAKRLIRKRAGIDWNKLKLAYEYSHRFTPDSRMVVVRNGWLVGEWGSRERYAAASVSKSLTGLALAKLFDLSAKGEIEPAMAPDDYLRDYLPAGWDGGDSRKRKIRIDHVMTMSSGLLADDDPNQPNYAAVMLSQPQWATPGKQWSYASLPVDLLSMGVQGRIGEPLGEFFNEAIAAPIGMAGTRWTEFDGYTKASSGVRLSPRDLARVGYLSLMRGRWGDAKGQKQIIAGADMEWLRHRPDFLDEARYAATEDSPFPVAEDSPDYFGRLWWTNGTGEALGKKVPSDAFYAHGYRESLLVVVPSLDLVVVRFGPKPLASAQFRKSFMTRVMAAVL
jgi:CubicO group peptidase (beta-lactamase class C family)